MLWLDVYPVVEIKQLKTGLSVNYNESWIFFFAIYLSTKQGNIEQELLFPLTPVW